MLEVTRMRAFLAVLLVAGFMAALVALFRQAIPQSNEQLLSYMLGQLSGFVAAIVSFDFGSSRGSEQKTELLSQSPTETQKVEVVNPPTDPVQVEVPTTTYGKID